MLGRKRKYNFNTLVFLVLIFPPPALLLPFYPSETTAFGHTDLGISWVLTKGSELLVGRIHKS